MSSDTSTGSTLTTPPSQPDPLLLLGVPVVHGPAQEYTRHWLVGQVRRAPRAVAEVLAEAAWNALKEPA